MAKRQGARKNPLGGKGNTALWSNQLKKVPCFIIGNGPSLKNINIDVLKENYFTIGINRSFLAIDTTILIWQDYAIWQQHKKKIKKLKAIKYCRKGANSGDSCYLFNMAGRDSRITMDPAQLHGRGSSGPLAFQLAYSLGCNPIVLLGMDCRYDKKTGDTDFYGKNKMHRPHTLPSCNRGLKWIRKNKGDRIIINCSKNKIFEEKVGLEEAIKTCGEEACQSRKYFIKKLFKDS
jgi:hypothetical protein